MPTRRGPRRVVIKLTGNLFSRSSKSTLRPYVNLLQKLSKSGVQPLVVTGGGETARQFIKLARGLGAEEASLDELGIMVSRVNAKVLISGLGESAYPNVPTSIEGVADAAELGRTVVCGGMTPGQSTNAVASVVAERVRAQLYINASDTDGVYTSDPKSHPSARKLTRVTTSQLSKILSSKGASAGTYELMDQIALKVIERSGIPTRIVRCTPEVIQKVVQGKALGTLVTPSR